MPIDIVRTTYSTDSHGFADATEKVVASVKAYREDRHGSVRWRNLAAFSEATALFKFRKIQGEDITTEHVIVCADGRYRIISIEDVKHRGMYYEALAEKITPSVR